MLKYKTTLRKLIRPSFIFFGLVLLLYVLFIIIDIAHGTTNSTEGVIRYSFTGSIFLAVCLAVFSVNLVTGLVAKFRSSFLPWLTASIMCLLLVGFSFFAFNGGRRIVTEADGPASVGYFCVWAELSDTVDVLTDNFSKASPEIRNKNLCILKNMPLATSNYAPRNASYSQDFWDDSILMIYGALVLASYFSSRYLYYRLANK